MAPFHLSDVPLLDTAELSVENERLVYIFVKTDRVHGPFSYAIEFMPSPGMRLRVAYHTKETLLID